MRMVKRVTVAVAIVAMSGSMGAQAAVTAADVSRLETAASDIDRQITTLRRTDPTLAASVERSLADLRDDITYLRVKLRREGNVMRPDYAEVRDRLETLRIKAQ